MYKLLRKLLPVLLVIACTNTTNDITTVLTLGRLHVTNYEIQKQLQRRNKKEYSERDRDELLNRYVVIAEALRLQYDTTRAFKDAERHVADYLMVQPNGMLWNKNVDPQARQYAEITKEKIKKRSHLYHFDIIRCKKQQSLIDALGGDSLIRNSDDFKKLKLASGINTGIENTYQTLQWPFLSYFSLAENLCALKEGDVSSLWRYYDYYYCFYLDRKEPIELGDDDKSKLKKELYEFKARSMDAEIDKELLAQGKPEVNSDWLKKLYKHLQNGGVMEDYNGSEWVLRYSLNRNREEVSFEELMASLKYYPMPATVTTREQIKQMALQFYYRQSLCNTARKMGLYDDTYFQLDMNAHRNNWLFRSYLEREIVSNCKIEPYALFQYYQDSIQEFEHSRHIIADAYFFKSIADADENWIRLHDFYAANSPNKKTPEYLLNNLAYILPDYKIDKQQLSSLFQKDDFYKIEDLQPGHVSYSVAFKGYYVLFVDKAEEGSYTKPFIEVRDEIHENMTSELINRKIKERMAELREKYATDLDGVNLFDGVEL